MNISAWPFFDKKDIQTTSEILESGKVNYWTGQECKLFENEFSEKFDSKFAISMANGSVALSSCYEALSLNPGDEIITTPRTYIATSSSAVLQGLKPIFADVDRNSGCITDKTIEPLINKNTKAITVVHIGGWPAEMNKICDLAKTYNLKIIEDCAQSPGAKINGKNAGTFGDVSAWSFCQDKIISTCGEGGMVTTSDENIWRNIWSFKDHGKSYEKMHEKNSSPSFKWVHNSFGTNFRMTEIQAAIGRNQLKRFNDWHLIRKRNAEYFIKELSDLNLLRIPFVPSNIEHAWYKFTVYLNSNALASDWSREKILSAIRDEGYPAFSGSCSEIYLEKCFIDNNIYPKNPLPIARELGETSLTFLIHPTISMDQLQKYGSVIKEIVLKASR